MANQSVDNALVIQFSSAVHVKAQQSNARLRQFVRMTKMTGDFMFYDGLGRVEATEVLGRNVKVEFSDIEHLRRKLRRRRFAITLPIDDMDVNAMLQDLNGEYAAACVRGISRKFDAVVVEAMFATVYTGREGETAVTSSSDGVETVNATSGLTYDKLLEIRQNFMDNEVGNDQDERFVMGISGDELTALMKETEVINSDYTRQSVVDRGRLEMVSGINLVPFAGAVPTPILPVASTTRDCFCMSDRAMLVGMSSELEVKVQERSDYYQTTQVQVIICFGAVRTEGVLIQKVQTTAS